MAEQISERPGRDLLVQVSLVESEFAVCKSRLLTSLNGFLGRFAGRISILVVYQTDRGIVPAELAALTAAAAVELQTTSRFSVSCARNRGIEKALREGFRYLLFHDAQVFYTPSFWAMIERTLADDLPICLGRLEWREPTAADAAVGEAEGGRVGRFRKVPPDPVGRAYVWAYLFRVSRLGEVRFSESIGPGRDSLLNAGEDILFLYQLFRRQARPVSIAYFPAAMVLHPPRPADFSKHFEYAWAQGALFRLLWLRHFRFPGFFALYLLLFLLAAFGRVLLLRKNSLGTLRQFLRGFRRGKGLRELCRKSRRSRRTVVTSSDQPPR